MVQGVQGRYYRPLTMLFSAAAPMPGAPRLVTLRRRLVATVALFPASLLGKALSAVIARYDLS